ncbi:MAG TPA: zinc ribbon domain-containing protein [Pyrinomonadaceae bacterium]|nr:zinc ribbon domain-containing protein [Pyrinomonadaceae bacterium]
MFCPQCGQQQPSEDMRFCSRCGFQLQGVTQLLATGGQPALVPMEGGVRRRSPRYEGVKQGVSLFLIGMVLVPLVAVFSTLVLRHPELFVPPVAIICFVGGLMRIIYALIFQEGAKSMGQYDLPAYAPPTAQQQMGAGSAARLGALPPQRVMPVSGWRRPDTAELVQPPSVTENTTKLLDKEVKPPDV